jgi:hypothetical protein
LLRCLGCWCEVGDACEGSGSFTKDTLAVSTRKGDAREGSGNSVYDHKQQHANPCGSAAELPHRIHPRSLLHVCAQRCCETLSYPFRLSQSVCKVAPSPICWQSGRRCVLSTTCLFVGALVKQRCGVSGELLVCLRVEGREKLAQRRLSDEHETADHGVAIAGVEGDGTGVSQSVEGGGAIGVSPASTCPSPGHKPLVITLRSQNTWLRLWIIVGSLIGRLRLLPDSDYF